MTTFLLKIIAALTMTVDHAGMLLFPRARWMRAVGRLAFPIYAFFIAEGFRHTKNRLRYFLSVFVLGVGCQIVYTLVTHDMDLNVLLTFSLSIALLWLLDRAKKSRRDCAVFILAIAAAALLCRFVRFEYGFWGVMLPLFPSLFEKKWHRFASFAVGLLILYGEMVLSGASAIQLYAILALLPLALYNGKRGKYKLKYFFYVFYPVHLAVLYGIAYLT